MATFKLLLLYVVELRKAYEYVRLHNVFITSDYILYFVTYCTFLYYFLQSKTSKLLQVYGVFFLILFKSLTNLISIKSPENKIDYIWVPGCCHGQTKEVENIKYKHIDTHLI